MVTLTTQAMPALLQAASLKPRMEFMLSALPCRRCWPSAGRRSYSITHGQECMSARKLTLQQALPKVRFPEHYAHAVIAAHSRCSLPSPL